jgi:hypothetical protein
MSLEIDSFAIPLRTAERSGSTIPDAYLPPDEGDELGVTASRNDYEMELADALEPVSRSGSVSPHPSDFEIDDEDAPVMTPKKNYDYSVSLKSEPEVRLSQL